MGIAPAHEQGVAVEIEAGRLACVHRLGKAVGIVEAGAAEAVGEGLERPAMEVVVEAGEEKDIRPRLGMAARAPSSFGSGFDAGSFRSSARSWPAPFWDSSTS